MEEKKNKLVNPYRVKTIICENGVRLPLLVSAETSLPYRLPHSWLLFSRRINNQTSTLQREIRTIGFFHWWANNHNIDLIERLQSGYGLSSDEINPSLYDWLRKDFTTGTVIKRIAVTTVTLRTRLETVRDYILWHLDQTLSRMDMNNPLFERISEKRSLIQRQFNKDLPSARNNRRIGLDTQPRKRFMEIINPIHPENPWHKPVRFRNYLLCLLYIGLGLRRAEALKIYLGDLNLNGSRPTLTIKRRPDDINDPRLHEPRVKTLGRIIPLNPNLVSILNEYILKHRTKIPNTKKSPFLFLSSKTGSPLNQGTVNNIIAQIVKKHSEFKGILTPHILRHSYNDTLSEIAKENGVSEHDAMEIRNYLCGWTRSSK
jgi:integrase